jgi:hypothetical protein
VHGAKGLSIGLGPGIICMVIGVVLLYLCSYSDRHKQSGAQNMVGKVYGVIKIGWNHRRSPLPAERSEFRDLVRLLPIWLSNILYWSFAPKPHMTQSTMMECHIFNHCICPLSIPIFYYLSIMISYLLHKHLVGRNTRTDFNYYKIKSKRN